MSVGKLIRKIRRSKDVTLEELGAMSGLSKSYLSLVESGKRTPSIEVLTNIAIGLDCELMIAMVPHEKT